MAPADIPAPPAVYLSPAPVPLGQRAARALAFKSAGRPYPEGKAQDKQADSGGNHGENHFRNVVHRLSPSIAPVHLQKNVVTGPCFDAWVWEIAAGKKLAAVWTVIDFGAAISRGLQLCEQDFRLTPLDRNAREQAKKI